MLQNLQKKQNRIKGKENENKARLSISVRWAGPPIWSHNTHKVRTQSRAQLMTLTFIPMVNWKGRLKT